MNTYSLIEKSEQGTRVVDSTVAATQTQAQRKLLRAHNIEPSTAKQLGYSIQFQQPTKVTANAQFLQKH